MMSKLTLLKEYKYKGYYIREYEQNPGDDWKYYCKYNDYELEGDELGEGAYEILNTSKEVIDSDRYCMGDSACENAEREIDFLTKEEA